eukprot:CAMPEP_0114594850 /NCGR_PEP_ID=MMETSP0125-20121206/16566_1 /TAXON_ID=485358 ORGANISM="Aristerostoma sp., Strain ATCC 50986" /NCGR_SAMPLE_ID=MMETSP0125 /ASSEMBLY_ACC=CAM_ASM_000245 /LENGTH=133 /DNA_ID=CAMNT_0001795685 /DNA_START=21 /DNA_END=422 /DNA_ORIENTATION=-
MNSNTQYNSIVFGGGCFWCVEAIFQRLKGVKKVESGYAGGSKEDPTYQQVCTGETGHAEVVKVSYDPEIINVKEILKVHLMTHDPTQLNRQGNDVGTQYRSVIFYSNEDEKKAAEEAIKEIADEKVYKKQIVT